MEEIFTIIYASELLGRYMKEFSKVIDEASVYFINDKMLEKTFTKLATTFSEAHKKYASDVIDMCSVITNNELAQYEEWKEELKNERRTNC